MCCVDFTFYRMIHGHSCAVEHESMKKENLWLKSVKDNIELSSKNLWKMISADAKADKTNMK